MSHYNRPTSSMSASGGGSGSTNVFAGSGAGGPTATREKTYFEQQREALIGEIAMSFEHVLANINKLNRSLEAVIAVGNEFSSVEALWSQFENVMAKEPEDAANPSTAAPAGEAVGANQQQQHIKTEDGEGQEQAGSEHETGSRGRSRGGNGE
ncbi:DASH complex subunit Dad1-domain-containing protein [Microdochium bolleyi]|uniref:DASH complex subunit DAD1 n=1 Tax=Microdochium bolleyi TaxID=196109 RepID=A0A136JGV5_9PEZI|nr:DASH complex subunit Dad1-domain-containing protein [Microdochium bolleyi]